MDDFVMRHYTRLAPNYNAYWKYSPSHIKTLGNEIIRILDINPDDAFVDIGCGTGLYSDQIATQTGFTDTATCVDPCREMLAQIPNPKRFRVVNADAESFASRPDLRYNKVLVKEVIQHVVDFKTFLNNIHNSLSNDGRILIIKNVFSDSYPLFGTAKALDRNQEKSTENVLKALEGCGFKTSFESLFLPVALEKGTYFDMIRGRYLSFLSRLSDDDIESGIKELDSNYRDQEILFTDNFQFILGIK
jgi:ubiquinone/menaquinone biosynthesis C-methylase UbiE